VTLWIELDKALWSFHLFVSPFEFIGIECIIEGFDIVDLDLVISPPKISTGITPSIFIPLHSFCDEKILPEVSNILPVLQRGIVS